MAARCNICSTSRSLAIAIVVVADVDCVVVVVIAAAARRRPIRQRICSTARVPLYPFKQHSLRG